MTGRAPLSGERGFGIPELLIAMLVMSIGIMAIVAGFSSGIVALDRASRNSTAGTLADKQMEAYRALPFKRIALADSQVGIAAAPYASDPAYVSGGVLTDVLLASNATAYETGYCSTTPVTCLPVQAVTGPDGRSYRVDTYIVWDCPLGTLTPNATSASPTCETSSVVVARPVKKITVVVRDGVSPGTKTYIRSTSTFDEAT